MKIQCHLCFTELDPEFPTWQISVYERDRQGKERNRIYFCSIRCFLKYFTNPVYNVDKKKMFTEVTGYKETTVAEAIQIYKEEVEGERKRGIYYFEAQQTPFSDIDEQHVVIRSVGPTAYKAQEKARQFAGERGLALTEVYYAKGKEPPEFAQRRIYSVPRDYTVYEHIKVDIVAQLTAYKQGMLTEKETAAVFQQLIDHRMIQNMDAHYQHIAKLLLEDGKIHQKRTTGGR